MESANLELVRSIRAAWERGDYSSSEWADPAIELVYADGPAPGSRTGLASGRDFSRDLLSAFEDFRGEAESYRELDDERVLVLIRFRGRGKTSGVELEQMQAKGANIFHIQAGKVTKVIIYFDQEHALADLRLTSDTKSPKP
jgi:ketosteroid isomerase-like protein